MFHLGLLLYNVNEILSSSHVVVTKLQNVQKLKVESVNDSSQVIVSRLETCHCFGIFLSSREIKNKNTGFLGRVEVEGERSSLVIIDPRFVVDTFEL